MKIKNSCLIYLLVTALAVGSIACNKLLDVPPQGKLTYEEFWNSKDQSVAAIAGLYSMLGSSRANWNGNQSATAVSPVECYVYWGEMRGEYLASNPGKLATDQVNKENIDNFLVTPNDVLTKFTQFYKIIIQANQCIKNIPGVGVKDPAFAQTEVDQLTGEAYFIRAFCYFWLVRAFNEVPLMLGTAESDVENFNIPKASTEEIYSQIIADLDMAKTTLPDWYSNVLYAKCRASKNTASTVLADVYLWKAALSADATKANQYYDLALVNCNAVINSNKYLMLHGSILSDVWKLSSTSESIFETFSDRSMNNQINNIRGWFSNNQYYIATGAFGNLFGTVVPEYRGLSTLIPKGPNPPAGIAFTVNPSNNVILKYQNSTDDNKWNFYRLPEVLLMKAEALAHRWVDDPTKLQQASDLVNLIRARAFGATEYAKIDGVTTIDMDNLILDERGREFIAEGKRWFELVRFATRDNFAHKELLTQRIIQSYSGVNQFLIGARVSTPASWYLPINADALSANKMLKQNPYYE